jgi:hypothetical protein
MARQGVETGPRQDPARTAVLAGAPALGLTIVAALTSSSLAVRADLLLSLLDMAALLAVWRLARLGGVRAERQARLLVTLAMTGSLALVTVLAAGRLAGADVVVAGPGLWLALAQNLAFALTNGWMVARWRHALTSAPSEIARSQVRLFADKLTSNLLLAGSLGLSQALDDPALARHIDLLAALAMTLATTCWALPTIRASLQELGIMRSALG